MRFEHRAVPIVLAAVLVDTIGFGIIMPVFPELITHLGHVDLEQATRIAGYMLVVFAFTQFFAGPVLGNLSDRFGRRVVLIASMLAFAADYALMAIAPTLAWLFLGRAIAGIAGAVYGPASSVLADVTPPEKRAGVFGFIGAAFGVGFIIGPAIGGLLADFGPRAPFVAAAVLALLNATAMIVAMPETLAPENRRPFHLRDAHIVGAFRPLFAAGNAAPLLLAWFFWQLAHMVYPATWAFWAAIRFGWSPAEIGWSLAFVGLISVIFQAGLSGRIIARIGERRAVMIGLASGGLTFLIFAFITASWQAYALFLLSAFSGLVFPAMNGLLSRMVDATRQGALQGGIGSMGSVSQIVGPLLLTQALATGVDRGFPGAAFLVASVLALTALGTIAWKVLDQVAPPAEPPTAPMDA
ncbi:MAG: tetracycline resistance MFS efflux pump [Pseudomonadota bacterium]|uniref:tetracycline resistance MFS efflux pump n=1 Tax=Sphingomonas sp. ERG5 TaxID=1381597 RepID=UPI00054C5971|nr:tetracycline resistance MFS efflux pump [Sphingomonas sp. ERG5]